jgi:hypothetical protein
MKKIVLLATILFSSFIVVHSQSSTDRAAAERQRQAEQEKRAQEALAENPNAPVIKFDKVVHDYGEIEQHGDGNCEFKFTNTGKEPLILSNVRSSCGCTAPSWPRQPILPGQSEVIKVKYDTKRIGIINKSVQVYSNATEKNVVLKIKGKVNKPSSAMPEKNKETAGTPVNK